MQGGIGWNLSISGVDRDPCVRVLSDVPVSRNWYKIVSNVYENLIYIKFCIKIVGFNSSYSANAEPFWKQRYPWKASETYVCSYYYLKLIIFNF